MRDVYRFAVIGFMLIAAVVPVSGADDAKPSDGKASKLVPLNKQETVLLDADGKRLILKSEVVLTEGLLELLACLKQTKEHEAVLSVPCKAREVHAGLLALGAEPGTPVQFVPDFKPPTGQKIDIFLSWTDEQGNKHRDPARTWIRHATRRYFIEPLAKLPNGVEFPKDKNLKYDEKRGELLWYGSMTDDERELYFSFSKDKAYRKAVQSLYDQTQLRELESDFVFPGSSFYTDEKTNQEFYQAESGDLISVANFASSVIDISAESSNTNDGLLFEAYTERIPPAGTKVQIELVPVFEKKKKK